MSARNPSNEEIARLLSEATTVAVVGASTDPDRPSYGIMQKLESVGYRVIPVNPRWSEVLGKRSYASLRDIPDRVDIVDVLRRAEYTPAIADDAVAIGAKALWLQAGIINEEAADRAEAGGLMVVMDACIGTMHAILRIRRKARTDAKALG